MLNEKAATRPRLIGLAATALILMATAGSSSQAADWQKVVDDANSEGKLLVYVGKSDPTWAKDITAAFEKAYPSIVIELTRVPSPEQVTRLGQEFQTGKAGADFVINSQYAFFPQAEKDGNLLPIDGPADKSWPDKFKLGDGTREVMADEFVLAWNTDKVPGGLTSYEDLVKPEFKGRLILPDISQSTSANAGHMDWMRKQFGSDFWAKLAAQNPTFMTSTQGVVQSIAAGENWVTPWGLASTIKSVQETGAPIKYFVPASGYSLLWYAAIPKTAGHPNAARVFMNWLETADGQTVLVGDHLMASPLNVSNAIGPIDQLDASGSQLTQEQADTIISEWKKVFNR